MKKITILLVLINLCISCNTSEKKTSNLSVTETETNENIKKNLSVEFVFKTNKPDVFYIKMDNIEIDELQKKHIHIFENVTPTSKEDKIIAKFDAQNMSKHILINLGTKEIKEVEIIEIALSYGDNHYRFNSVNDINKYFAFNRFIDVEEDSKILKTKTVGGRHNPAISVRQNLIRLLTNE